MIGTPVESVNHLRMVLVVGAAIAAVAAVVAGQPIAAVVLSVGVVVHGFLTLHLRRVAPAPVRTPRATGVIRD